MKPKTVLGAFAALFVALLGGWLWTAPRTSDLERALRAIELQSDLREAHASLLGARVDLYEGDFSSATRHLENARDLLRRADARARRLGWQDEVTELDAARFEADLDEAQRLLGQLEQGAGSPWPLGHGLVDGPDAQGAQQDPG